MQQLFVDTSAWHALADSKDSHHSAAKAVSLTEFTLVTSSFVLLESWQLASVRGSDQIADQLVDRIRSVAEVIEPLSVDLDKAQEIQKHFSDQAFSFADRVSFSIMERLGLTHAFVFDRHFSVYRYGPNRKRTFQLVPATRTAS